VKWRSSLGGFVTALKGEAFVMGRTLSPWLLLVLPALVVVIRLLLTKAMSGTEPEAARYGYGHLVDAFATGLTLLYLVFIAYAAHSFAVDRDRGVLRHLFIRSVSRGQLVLAKLVLLHLLALLSVLLVLLLAWVLSRWLWDLGPVVEDGFELISEAEIHEEIRNGLLLALMPLPACLALGLLISVVARSATQAVAVAVGLALLVDLFKGIVGQGANYWYGSFQPSLVDQSYLGEVARIVRGYSDVLIDPGFQQLNLWVPLPQALIFVIAALVVARRRTI